MRQVDLKLWDGACKHHYGKGLCKGVDWTQVKAKLKLYARLEQRLLHKEGFGIQPELLPPRTSQFPSVPTALIAIWILLI